MRRRLAKLFRVTVAELNLEQSSPHPNRS